MMHGLRHHFGSTHAAKGTPLPTLQRLLRHGSTSMTMRYITILDSENIEAAEKIEKVFDSLKVSCRNGTRLRHPVMKEPDEKGIQ